MFKGKKGSKFDGSNSSMNNASMGNSFSFVSESQDDAPSIPFRQRSVGIGLTTIADAKPSIPSRQKSVGLDLQDTSSSHKNDSRSSILSGISEEPSARNLHASKPDSMPSVPPRQKSVGFELRDNSRGSLMSELSDAASGRDLTKLHQTRDNLGHEDEAVSTETPLLSNIPRNGRKESRRKKSAMIKILKDLDCILDSDDKEEQDPFSTRRLCFMAFVAVLAIILNLVVIPISLTRREERNRKETTPSPTTFDPLGPSPGGIPPASPSFSPTSEGQTRLPTSDETDPISDDFIPVPVPSPNLSPQSGPTSQPAPLTVALPPYTLTALDYPFSPQLKAFHWLTADPNLGTYSTSRILQRMALATLFFSTNEDFTMFYDTETKVADEPQKSSGVDHDLFSNLFSDRSGTNQNSVWINATNWLSYEVHECFWYSQASFVCDANQNYRFLLLQDNNLCGRLPPELALLTRLEQMHLGANPQLYGSIPPQFGAGLTQLRSLWLSDLPQLSGTIPTTITNLHASLEELHLRETPYFSKILSTELGRLTRLRELLLDTQMNRGSGVTSREGTIPTELGNMRALESFAISGEHLIGTLPQELAGLSNLEWLHISNTQIFGPIPEEFGFMKSISNLELSRNRLSGTLPKELGYLRKTLTNLELNGNLFTGTIPFQYSNLTKCESMSFQGNQLTGTVPLGLCYLKASKIIKTLSVDCEKSENTVSKQDSDQETFPVYSPVECTCDCKCY